MGQPLASIMDLRHGQGIIQNDSDSGHAAGSYGLPVSNCDKKTCYHCANDIRPKKTSVLSGMYFVPVAPCTLIMVQILEAVSAGLNFANSEALKERPWRRTR